MINEESIKKKKKNCVCVYHPEKMSSYCLNLLINSNGLINDIFPLGGTFKKHQALVCDCWSMAHPHLGKSILLEQFIYVLKVLVSFQEKSANKNKNWIEWVLIFSEENVMHLFFWQHRSKRNKSSETDTELKHKNNSWNYKTFLSSVNK